MFYYCYRAYAYNIVQDSRPFMYKNKTSQFMIGSHLKKFYLFFRPLNATVFLVFTLGNYYPVVIYLIYFIVKYMAVSK